MNVDKMMKECTKPHPLLHTLGGVGLGILLVGLVPTLGASAVMLGIILLVGSIVGEFLIKR